MTLADDANAPVHYAGRDYQPLTMADVAALTGSIPAELTPRELLPYVGVTEAMRFARSAFGLPALMAIVAAKSNQPTDDLAPHQQLELAGRLTERFYGFDAAGKTVSKPNDDTGNDDPLADAPAS